MSNNKKFIVRPKVRFCQTSDSVEDEQVPSTSSHDQKASVQLNKPQIRSVVTIKQPIKIISHDQIPASVPCKNETDCHSIDHIARNKCLVQSKRVSAPCLSEVVHSVSQNPIVTSSSLSENRNGVKDARRSENVTTNPITSNLSSVRKVATQNNESPIPNDQMIKTVPCKDTVASSNVTAITTTLNSQNNKEANANKSKIHNFTLQNSKCVPRNYGTVVKKKTASNIRDANYALESKTRIKSTMNQKNKACTSAVMSKSRGTPCITKEAPKKSAAINKTASCMRKCATTKSNVMKVMPCLKTARVVAKATNPMTKTVLRDIVGYPTKVYVGPGVPRYTPHMFKTLGAGEPLHIRPDIVSGEKLDRPEYNSIMCTINKLKEVQKENFVTDVEHLPMVYKNLVNGKISTALDFRLDETVYKNLVDLSIDENQLPCRLTRSKDPEPRQRDIVPKLSDFFIPKYAEEYCSAVHVRPQSPENVGNWSAFAISDKLFGWKYDMDHAY